MKKLLLTAALCSVMTSFAAETYEFSYVDECENFLGIQSPETYDVAVFLPGDQFKDFKVVSFNAPVNASPNGLYTKYYDISVWASATLKVADGKNAPDVSFPAKIDRSGNITLELPEAYSVPENGAYVGYSISVRSLDDGTKFPIGIGTPSNINGLWIRTSKSVPQWSNLALSQGVSSAITLGVQSDNIAPEAVSFVEAPRNLFTKAGDKVTADFLLATYGSAPVSSVDIDYTIAGTPYSCHYDLPEALPVRLGKAFTVGVELPVISQALSENVEFTVSKVNGVDNKAASGAKVAVNLGVMDRVPKHQTLLEEYTGGWCGNCPRGYAALEYIRENYPEFITAAYHYNDPMAVVSDYPSNPAGYPYAFLNRSVGCDPYYGTEKYNSILPVVDDIKELNDQITPWEVNVSYAWESDDVLVAKADVCSYVSQNGDYKIGYILVGDGISGKSASWVQYNNYSSYAQSADVIPQLNDFCNGGKYGKRSVRLVYNDVVISPEGIAGVEGSVPESLAAGERVSHSFSFDISTIDKRLVPDKTKLRVIAVVLDRKGIVLNAAKVDVNKDFSAVDGIDAEDLDAPVEYFNLNGVKVSEPSNGIFIRRQGSRSSKVVIK